MYACRFYDLMQTGMLVSVGLLLLYFLTAITDKHAVNIPVCSAIAAIPIPPATAVGIGIRFAVGFSVGLP